MIWLMVNKHQSGKVLRHKAFEISSNPKCDGYQRGFSSMLFKFFDESSAAESGIQSISNQQLAIKLHKLISKKFERRRVYSSFKDNIWGADLADMQFNKQIQQRN